LQIVVRSFRLSNFSRVRGGEALGDLFGNSAPGCDKRRDLGARPFKDRVRGCAWRPGMKRRLRIIFKLKLDLLSCFRADKLGGHRQGKINARGYACTG